MLTVSKVYETRAIGFNGRNFYNLVVGFDCQEPALTINAKLKAIEAQHGRSSEKAANNSGILDLDLLSYGSQIVATNELSLPRSDVRRAAYALRPLVDIAPDTVDPITKLTYRVLWDTFADKSSILKDVSDLFE
ncbi:MAG: 2-amino-4-hydroxy-6-hydroxymethyldihydropteridine diphosphokinase [Gammaproteobacteria bacterium]|jgi:2-amino-4-hydroxy-6-hydroxymethyldihydropteridine diphosphokinase